MPTFWQFIASISFLAPPLAWRAERAYQTIVGLPTDRLEGPLPSLSIIIPARNEADNLRRLLPTLSQVDYPGPLEVLVVDDQSTDETAVIAESLGARVLQLAELPNGWLGKPHACHQGALAVSGDWLLFTDADTVHTTDGPARAVTTAVQQQLAGLSVFPGQQTRRWTDRLALTAAFAGLFAGLSAEQPILNGQYILLNRKAYANSGGFAAVRHEPLEDLALGQHLQQQGYVMGKLHGSSVVQVQMYASDRQLWQGLSRVGGGSLRWMGLGALITALFITAVMTPLLTIPLILTRRLRWLWLPVTWAAAVSGFKPWARRFGPAEWAFLAPVGALFVQIVSVWGLLRRLSRQGITWKGRLV